MTQIQLTEDKNNIFKLFFEDKHKRCFLINTQHDKSKIDDLYVVQLLVQAAYIDERDLSDDENYEMTDEDILEFEEEHLLDKRMYIFILTDIWGRFCDFYEIIPELVKETIAEDYHRTIYNQRHFCKFKNANKQLGKYDIYRDADTEDSILQEDFEFLNALYKHIKQIN